MKITAAVKKTSPDHKTFSSKFVRLEEIGGGIAHTLRTNGPNLDTENVNMIIEVEKIGSSENRESVPSGEEAPKR